MNETIGITAVGGGVGQSVLKALYGSEYRILAMDGETLGTGLYAAPVSYVIPYASNDTFIDALLTICKKEKISLLFPGLDAELKLLSLNVQKFTDVGTTVIVSRPDVIDVSDNKQMTYDFLNSIGLPVPYTQAFSRFQPLASDFPLIVKQKVGGARSKNVFLIRSFTEWENLKKITGDDDSYVVQEYIEGDEYTCGTVNLGGQCKGIIVMRRILRDGDTYKCFVEDKPVIEDVVFRLVSALQPFGACNIQLRLRNNIPYVFEINARCSGTTASRALCGFNEPKMIADYLLKGVEPSFQIQKKSILRYWKELLVENDEIESVKKYKSIISNNPRQL